MTDHPLKISIGLPDSRDMPVLVIGPVERAAIKAAIAAARAKPLTAEVAAEMFARGMVTVPSVAIPHGYHASVSFERHPVGLCIHLAVGVAQGGPPSADAVEMIANAFGLFAGGCLDVWLDPNGHPNLIALAPEAWS